MSLLAEYNASAAKLHGFTLLYKTFFSQFREDNPPGQQLCGYYDAGVKWVDTSPRRGAFWWNDKLLIPGFGYYTSEKEFVDEQLRWIQTEEVQTAATTDAHNLKDECQKRINFFVLKLHEKLGHGVDDNGDSHLGNIRDVALLCLK